MLRTVLMVIAAGGCILMGKYASSGLKRRHDTARAMLVGLMELSMRMQYSAAPIAELVLSCKTGDTAVFFDEFIDGLHGDSVYRAWVKAMNHARECDAGFASLQKEELTILEEFARGLGVSDLVSQAKNAALLEKRMEPVVLGLLDAYTRKGHIYKKMGVLGGIAVTILLI